MPLSAAAKGAGEGGTEKAGQDKTGKRSFRQRVFYEGFKMKERWVIILMAYRLRTGTAFV